MAKIAPPARAPFTPVIPRTSVIASVVPNPKMPGSKAFKRYVLYKKGMTVAAALKAGVTASDIRWDSEREFITIKK